jgi:mutator protein MutT
MSNRSKSLSTLNEGQIARNWRILFERKENAACVLIFDPEFRCLICKRDEDTDWMPGKWGFPGGGVEEGETPKQAAVREIKEETGLDVFYINEFHSNAFCTFFATRKYEGTVTLSNEHTEYAWVERDRLDQYDIIPGNIQIIEKALQEIYGV